jgi:hypothetical protein
MPSKYPLDTVLADSEQIVRVWTENPSFSLGEIKLTDLQSKITEVRVQHDQIETMRTQLTALSNELGSKTNELAGINTRARSGFRAVYGPDSSQYEQAGGTRQSERKRPTKKPKPNSTGSAKQ